METIQQTFCEKILLNLVRKLSKSYAYERAFNQLLDYRGYIFRDCGNWSDEVLEKRAAAKKAFKKKSKYSDDYEYPIPPIEYLDEKDINRLISHLEEVKPHLAEPFKFENSVNLFGDLLELGEVEKCILQMSMYVGGHHLSYPWDNIFSNITISTEFDEPGRVYELMFGCDESEIRKALQGFLFNSGLLVSTKRIRNLHAVAPELADTFGNMSVDVKDIDQSLFPSCLDTDLTVESYPHVLTEITRAEAIIDRSVKAKTKGINLMLWGLPGTGKTELALAMAKKNGWDLKVIGDSSNQDMTEKSRAQRLTSLKIAMKLYQNSDNVVLLFDEIEDLFKYDANAVFSKAFINRIIETTPVPIIWTTNRLFELGSAVLRRMTYNIGFEVPPSSARKKIWKGYTDKYGVDLSDQIIDELAMNYDIAPALINNAVRIAKLADLSDQEAVADIVKSLDTLVRYGEKRLFKPAEIKDTPYNSDWVNSDINVTDLTEKLLRADPAFSLLLFGAAGTGKSEYARYLAKKMGKRVLFKRASDLQSMWVGMTEKNIAAAFEEAKREEMFLIIDEGDSFLRNRETARASWEVSQVNEMLSQMENHTQPFVLTTNLMADLDPASMRRFVFKMEFKFLRPDQIEGIFEAYYGVKAPKKLLKLDCLAPGDFAAVRKKAKILGETDPNALHDMLLAEAELKPHYRKSNMGF